jgi:hypothetical protein
MKRNIAAKDSYVKICNLNDGIVSGEHSSDYSGVVYRLSGCQFIRVKTEKSLPKHFITGTRSDVTHFSASSGQRMRRYLRECFVDYSAMVTLTYPGIYSANGGIVKEHLRRFLQEVRRQYIRDKYDPDLFSAFWFLEFQERGAPHFHIFFTFLPDKNFISRKWYEIVDSEDERHLRAGTRTEVLHRGRAGTISYASKYAAKAEQKAVPDGYLKVGRFWGVWGNRNLMSADTYVTARQSRDGKVATIEKSINREVHTALRIGKAKELIHKPGESQVVLINCPHVLKRLSVYLCRLQCLTRHYPNIFEFAEIPTWQ